MLNQAPRLRYNAWNPVRTPPDSIVFSHLAVQLAIICCIRIDTYLTFDPGSEPPVLSLRPHPGTCHACAGPRANESRSVMSRHVHPLPLGRPVASPRHPNQRAAVHQIAGSRNDRSRRLAQVFRRIVLIRNEAKHRGPERPTAGHGEWGHHDQGIPGQPITLGGIPEQPINIGV